MSLSLLKQRMLLSELEKTSDPLLVKTICGVANQAAAMAWSTRQPLIAFPDLFESMMQEIRLLPLRRGGDADSF
jgi:hypothetical protein